MIDFPQTLEEARKRRYGQWVVNPDGEIYEKGSCAYEVSDPDGWAYRQCLRKKGYGLANLYCKQHAKIIQFQKRARKVAAK